MMTRRTPQSGNMLFETIKISRSASLLSMKASSAQQVLQVLNNYCCHSLNQKPSKSSHTHCSSVFSPGINNRLPIKNESRVMAGLLLSNLLSLLLGAGIGICIYRRCAVCICGACYHFFGIQINLFFC